MSFTPSITELSAAEYKKALTATSRRPTFKPDGSPRQRAGALRYLLDTTSTGVNVKLNKACSSDTACWRWDGKHFIEVNPLLPTHFLALVSDTAARRIELTKAVLAHEAAHGLYTSRSNPAHFAREAAAVRVPFRLLNLMEDCRIEWKYVKDRGKDFRFRWSSVTDVVPDPKDPITSPMSWLFMMKCREPALFKRISQAAAPFTWDGPLAIALPTVSYAHPMKRYEGAHCMFKSLLDRFYESIISADTTEDLLPIARFWVDIFGREDSSKLPPLLVHAVPGGIGGVKDPDDTGGGALSEPSSGAPSEVTTPHSHAATKVLTGPGDSDGRGAIYVSRVMHHNTDEFIQQPGRFGFRPLSDYCRRK
jgi:hypothetical protein